MPLRAFPRRQFALPCCGGIDERFADLRRRFNDGEVGDCVEWPAHFLLGEIDRLEAELRAEGWSRPIHEFAAVVLCAHVSAHLIRVR